MICEFKNIQVIEKSNQKMVAFAYLDNYGDVVIKKNRDSLQLFSEYKMLSQLKGKACCRVYEFDEQEGLLIEERILPGISLRNEKSLQNRLEALKSIFEKIHLPQKEGMTYLNWLSHVLDYSKNHLDEAWFHRATYATSFCISIFEKYPERVLLHGDLHHDNILLKGNDYVMIDPKGVIGPEILDLPRFILNEVDGKNKEYVNEVIDQICFYFHYPKLDLLKIFYMEMILACIWNFEDRIEVDHSWIELLDFVFNQIKNDK